MINHIISECSKLAQREYASRRDWVGNVIYCELCKKFKSNHTKKWYRHNPNSFQENETNHFNQGFRETNESSNLGQTSHSQQQ